MCAGKQVTPSTEDEKWCPQTHFGLFLLLLVVVVAVVTAAAVAEAAIGGAAAAAAAAAAAGGCCSAGSVYVYVCVRSCVHAHTYTLWIYNGRDHTLTKTASLCVSLIL